MADINNAIDVDEEQDLEQEEWLLHRTELCHRGFSAIILVNGVPAPIYRPEYESHIGNLVEDVPDKHIMTGWIPSEEGMDFSVAFQNDEGEDAEVASCGHIFVDGQDVASAILRPGRQIPAVRHGARISPTVTKPFTFSKIELTDDDSVADPNDPRAVELGTIRIEIKFVRLGKVVPLRPCDPEDIGPVHEKAKKAGVHTTTYRTTKRTEKRKAVSTVPLSPDNHVVFLFRYRSSAMLMAEGIMPRPLIKAESGAHDAAESIVSGRKRPTTQEESDTEDESVVKRPRVGYPSSEDDAGRLSSPAADESMD